MQQLCFLFNDSDEFFVYGGSWIFCLMVVVGLVLMMVAGFFVYFVVLVFVFMVVVEFFV